MTAIRYRALIQEFGRAQRASVGIACRHLELLLAEAPPDAAVAGELTGQLERLGRRLPAELERRWEPSPGEAHVLLVGPMRAHVGRLRVELRNDAAWAELDTPSFELDARRQLELVHEALVRLRASRGLGVPSGRLRVTAWTTEDGPITGESLGVAAAAAFVSAWSGRAPSRETVATAAVARDGTLRPVVGLTQKLEALSRAYPDVRNVVVARDQQVPFDTHGLHVHRCDTVEAALQLLGCAIDLFDAPLLATEDARREVEGLRHVRCGSEAKWRMEARKAEHLSEHPHLPAVLRSRARAFAALFSLHAAEDERAKRLIRDVVPATFQDADPVDQIWFAIIQASVAIDNEDLDRAVFEGERAVEAARATQGQTRRDVLGRALGTLGRAIMHKDDAASALAPFRESVAHHREHERASLPRSLTYLATALRRAGRLEDALDVVTESLGYCGSDTIHAESRTSRIFALYERGRIHFEEGRFVEALADLEEVRGAQADPWAYPRLGCERYLCALGFRLNLPIAEERMNEAIQRATDCERSPILRRIAIAACGEVLQCPNVPSEARRRALEIWDMTPIQHLGRLVY